VNSRNLIVFLLAAATCAQPLPKSDRPENLGFSSERLNRMEQSFQTKINEQRLPGAVLVVARDGKLAYFKALGYQNRAKNTPMTTSSIFRIFSMTKPIISVAAMMLVEEGKLDIAAPASRYLPEFAELKVAAPATEAGSAELTYEPLKRPMTVQDLLRHTSGLTYGLFGQSPVDKLYLKSNLFDTNQTLAGLVTKLSKLPLAHQPGAVWEYSVSTDVLARVVEVVSGKPIDQFIADRIAKPLGMHDTGFYLSQTQAGRLAMAKAQIMGGGDPTVKPAFFSGGGGLFSTAGDYARFCQMMLNGGELEGQRLLAPKTVALMTSNHLPASTSRLSPVAQGMGPLGPRLENGLGFGLGFAVRTAAGINPLAGSVGDYFWAGIAGTYFWVDPHEKMFAILMIQTQPADLPKYAALTRNLVYAALVQETAQ
jgi:CubicO group peptidase (beta-lactamase class C family)